MDSDTSWELAVCAIARTRYVTARDAVEGHEVDVTAARDTYTKAKEQLEETSALLKQLRKIRKHAKESLDDPESLPRVSWEVLTAAAQLKPIRRHDDWKSAVTDVLKRRVNDAKDAAQEASSAHGQAEKVLRQLQDQKGVLSSTFNDAQRFWRQCENVQDSGDLSAIGNLKIPGPIAKEAFRMAKSPDRVAVASRSESQPLDVNSPLTPASLASPTRSTKLSPSVDGRLSMSDRSTARPAPAPVRKKRLFVSEPSSEDEISVSPQRKAKKARTSPAVTRAPLLRRSTKPVPLPSSGEEASSSDGHSSAELAEVDELMSDTGALPQDVHSHHSEPEVRSLKSSTPVGRVYKKLGIRPLRVVQSAICASTRLAYSPCTISICASCARPVPPAGSARKRCRFVGVRVLEREDGDEESVMKATGFVEEPPEKEILGGEAVYRPKEKMFQDETLSEGLKRVCAATLLPVLEAALRHQNEHPVDLVHRRNDGDLQPSCDVCEMGLLAGSFMCSTCGTDVCTSCFNFIDRVESASAPDAWTRSLSSKCPIDGGQLHVRSDFRPVTWFAGQWLFKSVAQLQRTLAAPPTIRRELSAPVVAAYAQLPNLAQSGVRNVPMRLLTPPFNSTSFELAFTTLLSAGEPFLVRNVFKAGDAQWTPDNIMAFHAGDRCDVIHCDSTLNDKPITIREFFGAYGDWAHRVECIVMNDWPQSGKKLKERMPGAYARFERMLPMPALTRDDASGNALAHLPTNIEVADLPEGPVLQSGFESSMTDTGMGTTRIRMDNTDSLHLMQHATARPCVPSSPAAQRIGAVWDIFATTDTPVLRRFLRKTQRAAKADPVREEKRYLDNAMMRRLFEEEGLVSWRVVQRPGDAVIVPAGCAYQICNISDCITVSHSFVSPANIERAGTLSGAFRDETKAFTKGGDLLPEMQALLCHTWASYART